jgi:hypothetical protein
MSENRLPMRDAIWDCNRLCAMFGGLTFSWPSCQASKGEAGASRSHALAFGPGWRRTGRAAREPLHDTGNLTRAHG